MSRLGPWLGLLLVDCRRLSPLLPQDPEFVFVWRGGLSLSLAVFPALLLADRGEEVGHLRRRGEHPSGLDVAEVHAADHDLGRDEHDDHPLEHVRLLVVHDLQEELGVVLFVYSID